MSTGSDQDAVVAYMNEVEHHTKGDECLDTLSLPSQQETQNERGKSSCCLLTDDVIELADATEISSIFDCMEVVEETIDVIGAMNIRSSLRNSLTNTTTPPSLDQVEAVEIFKDTLLLSQGNFASLEANNIIDSARGSLESRAVDLAARTDNPNQEETSIQPSTSHHGHFVKPAPSSFSRDPKAPVCLPQDSSLRMQPHSSTSTSVTCRVCLATFETKSQMFRHIRKDHGGFKKDVTKGRETLSSAPTSHTAQFKDEKEGKQEPDTGQEPLTSINEQDIICEQTGKAFQDAIKAISAFASGQKLVAQNLLDNGRFVTPFEQLDLQWSVARSEELAKIGKRLNGWVKEMVQNGIERHAQQQGQESRERDRETREDLAKRKEKEQEAGQLELELELELGTNPNGTCEDLIDLSCD